VDWTRSQAVTRIADRTASQHLWVMWRHPSRDHLIAHMPFPICSPLERSHCLQPFSRYCAVSILGSRVWPFKVTWRHLSRDHSIAYMPFPIGGPLEPLSLSETVSYSTSNVTQFWDRFPLRTYHCLAFIFRQYNLQIKLPFPFPFNIQKLKTRP